MPSPSPRPSPSPTWLTPAALSLVVHGALAGAMGYAFYQGGALIAGEAGLAGATRTRTSMVVTMDEIVVPPPTRTAPPPVSEGLAIAKPLPRELPTEVKAVTREIEETPPAEPPSKTAAEGNSNEGPEGAPGQGGTSNVAAAQLGQGDRTNALGLHMSKIHRKVQAELRTPGYLPETKKAMIQVVIETTGNVSSITVHRSAGERKLDLIAIDAVKRAQPFDPWEKNLTVIIPVNFKSSN